MIPLQENCNPANPEEMFLWMLLHLPNVGGVATVTHPDILRAWSKHLFDCGARFHPEHQAQKFQPPVRGQQSPYNGATKWVPMDTPEPKRVILQDPQALTREENAAMLARYRELGMIPEPTPAVDMAQETT